MSPSYPKPWNWSAEPRPRPLGDCSMAPEEFGFYEIGFFEDRRFEAKYGGRASGKTLRQRLRNHYFGSHNANIRLNRKNLWFRYKVFRSEAEAKFVEAIHISAFEYPWNDRNEWSSHWALDW